MSQVVSDDTFSHLNPIAELGVAARLALKQRAETNRLETGQKLVPPDPTTWLTYLVEGTLRLVSKGTVVESINEQSVRARDPIFADGIDFAFAEKPSRVVHVDRNHLATLRNEHRLDGFEVVDDPSLGAESAILHQLYEACNTGKLKVPSMPEVALRIRRMAQDPNTAIRSLAGIIQMDPAVSGKILHVANSALYRGNTAVNSVKGAVVRLGLEVTRNLATTLAMRDSFRASSPLIKRRMQLLWEHSVRISALSFVLARKSKVLDPERALFAGLVHDIGVVPILQFLVSNKLDLAAEELERTVESLRAAAGLLVLRSWGLEPAFTVIAEQADEWFRDTKPEPDYCDVVLIAHLCEDSDLQHDAALPSATEVPAFRKLGFRDASADFSNKMLEEAVEEIVAVQKFLG